MKKILMIIALFLVVGCNKLDNTPTKQVETFFNKYQTLDKEVLSDLDSAVAEESNFNTEQRDKYKSLMKHHYQNLSYEIKDSRVDGDKATVTVEIEVTDYSKVIAATKVYLEANKKEFLDESGNYDNTKFNDYRLEELSKTKDKVKYTLDLTLTKKDGEWKLDPITSDIEDKIHGIYEY
ncbi:MAG: hypothetical protein MR227_04575 [Firmicutes bacterium]|nr:hypothetical protein [Bacillota bacterium]